LRRELHRPGTAALFALPTQDQLDHLRDRLGTIRNDSDGEYSTNTEALTALGFQIPDTSDLKVWMYSPNYPSSDEAETYDFNTGKTDKHKITSESQFFYDFFCMTFPGPAELSSINPLLTNALPGSITVSSESTTQLVATANNSTITSPAGTVTRPADDITADVVWHSSNTNVADISNLGGRQGQITWHPAGIVNGGPSVTFTACPVRYDRAQSSQYSTGGPRSDRGAPDQSSLWYAYAWDADSGDHRAGYLRGSDGERSDSGVGAESVAELVGTHIGN